MMRRAALIFHPCSGRSHSEADLEVIQTVLSPTLNLEIQFTKPDQNTEQLTQELVNQGFDLIIASGGDGTVSSVATALLNTDIPLGIIPRGTANAFATSLNIPMGIEKACEIILQENTRRVDAASCNGKTMLTAVSIGFEAQVLNRVDREAKNRLGILAYGLGNIQELIAGIPQFETQIEIDQKVVTLKTSAITIANAVPALSMLAQGPEAVIADDGLLSVTLISPANLFDALVSAFELWKSAIQKKATNHPHIVYWETQKIKIVTDPPQTVVVDGDVFGKTPITVECFPKVLNVIVPDTSEQ